MCCLLCLVLDSFHRWAVGVDNVMVSLHLSEPYGNKANTRGVTICIDNNRDIKNFLVD